MENNPADKVVSDIKKDFVAMGAHRVHGWYAWAIVGIVVGMAWGIVYVSSWSNQKVTFDASNAAMDSRPQNSIVLISNPEKFEIIAPIHNAEIKTNPVVRIRLNITDTESLYNADLNFSYAEATADGRIIGRFIPITNPSQYKSVYQPDRLTYVLPSFTYFAPGYYNIRAILTLGNGFPSVYSDVIIHKVGQETLTKGECFCKSMKLEDQGVQNDTQHVFKVIATLDGEADNCGEHQYMKGTITYSNDDETITGYVTTAGVNVVMSKAQILAANLTGATITAMPYEGDGFAADDFVSTTDTDGDPEGKYPKKEHHKNVIIWYDAPGIKGMVPGYKNATFDAELKHVVNPGCECKTRIHIKVKDGKVVQNELDSDCD